MCFGKVIVTLLTLPWLNNAAANVYNNNSVLILYNMPPQRLQRLLEQMGRQTDISNCKSTENGSCVMTNQCSDIATFIVNKNATCSWLLYQQNVSLQVAESKPTSIKVWGFGLVSVGIISLSGLFGGLFWPLINSSLYKYMMHILIGLAVGSLSATSIFQLIPESFEIKNANQDYLNIAVFVWSSIWSLYILQVVSKIAFHHKHSHATACRTSSRTITVILLLLTFGLCHLKTQRKKIDTTLESQTDGLLSTTATAAPSPSDDISTQSDDKTTIAYMIIFGDALHNFIDGMSIGAGYSQDLSAGLGLSIAIACEEFPHELGDFAILINSGMPLKKALLYNFLSACTAFGGLALGIVIGELESNIYIFAFAGGLFLYISLGDLIPELNKMVNQELQHSRKSALFVLALQNTGTFIGVATLYLVSKYPVII